MDEENSFFTTLGRINSILFFLFILLGLGLLIFVTISFIQMLQVRELSQILLILKKNQL